MSKLQELLDKHKRELWGGGFGQLTAHIKAGVNCKGIIYRPQTSKSIYLGKQYIRQLGASIITLKIGLHLSTKTHTAP